MRSEAVRAAGEPPAHPQAGPEPTARLELLDVHGRFGESLGDGGGVSHLLRSGDAPSSRSNCLQAFPESFPRCDHGTA